MQREESSSEAGREGWFRVLDSDFSSGNLGSVTTQEPVLGLSRVKSGDWWQDSEGVTGQEDDILGMSSVRGELGIFDVLQWVRDSGVLSDGDVAVINNSL